MRVGIDVSDDATIPITQHTNLRVSNLTTRLTDINSGKIYIRK